MNKAGQKTGEFGVWLDSYVNELYPDLRVYYDHGDPALENVGAVQGFRGETANRKTILTNIDALIVKGNQVLLLIEIEDKAVMVPKKLLGTVFATLMCNQFAFGKGKKKKYFSPTPETQFILAGIFPKRGTKFDQLREVLEPGIRGLELVNIKNLTFVFEEQIDAVVQTTKERVTEKIKAFQDG